MASRSPIQYALALVLVIAAIAGAVWFLMMAPVRAAKGAAVQGAELLAKAVNLRPLITVDRTVVYQEKTPVLELITHRNTLQFSRKWTHTWLKSTKTIELNGRFSISVGFDLKERFSVSYDTRGKKIYVVHPEPKVLAVEVLELNDGDETGSGWLNRISSEDRTAATNFFLQEARAQAEQNTKLLDDARADLRRQLEEAFGKMGFTIEFQELGDKPVHIPVLP